MIRVLQFISYMGAGGAETMLMNIYRNIDREKIQFDFVVFSSEEGFYTDEAKKLGANIYTVDPIRKAGVREYLKQIKMIISEKGPYDAVHSHIGYISGLIMLAAKLENIPVRIAHAHSTNSTTFIGKSIILWRISQVLVNIFATDLLSCSVPSAIYYFGKNKAKKALVINNAIDIKRFCDNGQYNRESICRFLNLPNDKNYITHIGRFAPVKNHYKVVEIFKHYSMIDQNANLILVGDGDLQREIKEYVKEIGLSSKIHFLGLQKCIPEILFISEALILPSIHEGLPVTLIEAQAMNVPCIVSNSITPDVDCNIGLVSFVSNDDVELYIDKITKHIANRKHCDNSKIMTDRGYNITLNIDIVSSIYMSKGYSSI